MFNKYVTFHCSICNKSILLNKIYLLYDLIAIYINKLKNLIYKTYLKTENLNIY